MKNVEIVKENSNLNSKKGITLIALVITIVVLLILAGVTILTLTGENGILRRASNAAEATQKETATEKMNFKITNIQINTYAKEQRMPTLQEIADEFYEDDEIEYVITKEEVAAKEKIDVTGYSSIFTKLSEYPYEFEIDSSLRLASINGVKIADNSSSEEIATLKATIAEMQGKIKDLETNLNMANEKTAKLENSLSETNSELNTIKQNVGVDYSNMEWTLLDSTTSKTYVKSTKSIDSYKFICVCLYNSSYGIFNPAIMNVSQFKKMCTSSTSALNSQSTAGMFGEIYYNNGLYMKSLDGSTPIYVYGIK